MIEQFTREQLEQIRREMAMMDKNRQKDSLLHAQYARLERLFPRKDYQEVGLFIWSELRQALTVLCDHTIKNYDVRNTKRYSKQFGRKNTVSAEITDQYKAVCDDLIDVLERHLIKLDVDQMKARLRGEEV